MKVDITLITWNRQEMTEMCLDAIKRNTKKKNYNLIVIDNGSPKKMQDMLFKRWEAGEIGELVLNSENRGLEPARNQGLELVTSKYFICADNDCLPEPMDDTDWVEKLVKLMDENPTYGAISCRTQVMIGTGNIFEETDENGKELTDFPHPGGSLRIMRTDVVRTVGGWRDEPGRGAEERYICSLLREAGYSTAFATHIRTLHLFGDRSKNTDRWGYPKDWQPGDTGHSDIWHPVLEAGDDPEAIKEYLGADYGYSSR